MELVQTNVMAYLKSRKDDTMKLMEEIVLKFQDPVATFDVDTEITKSVAVCDLGYVKIQRVEIIDGNSTIQYFNVVLGTGVKVKFNGIESVLSAILKKYW